MTRGREKFTIEVMRQIRTMLAMGKKGSEIATTLGCDYGSLRSACKRSGITLRDLRARDVEGSIAIRITLPPEISDGLRSEARIRGVGSDILAAEIIDAVVNDKLYSAVLDK